MLAGMEQLFEGVDPNLKPPDVYGVGAKTNEHFVWFGNQIALDGSWRDRVSIIRLRQNI